MTPAEQLDRARQDYEVIVNGENAMKYQIWSNVTMRPDQFMSGYQPGDRMFKSWEDKTAPTSEPEDVFLEELFCMFNADERPNGKIAHSLSVGDVVVLNDTAYAVKSVGFERLPEFSPVIATEYPTSTNP
jgi:hypothetical protein